ncbi:MAG: T9SS type A sorting domain-containing protein [Ignavibacteriota bacterium]
MFHHIIPIEDSILRGYHATYIRDGKVVVSYPSEISEGLVHRQAGVPIDSVIDSSDFFLNPSIGYNPVSKHIGLIYSSIHAGPTVDTNIIWYRRSALSNPYAFTPAIVLDTVNVVHATDPTFLPTPAITACFDSTAFDFWVSWRGELNEGGVLGIINTSNVLVDNQFFTASIKQPKFISLASHKHLTGVRMAWEEYTNGFTYIYHANGNETGGAVSVVSTTNISPDFCYSHHPQIATNDNGIDEVVWEVFGSYRKKKGASTQFSNTVVHRLFHNTWGNYDQFFPVSKSLSLIPITPQTFTLFPTITKNDVLQWVPGAKWHDWTRIFWNNRDSSHTEIVHFGLVNWPPTWLGAIMKDVSLEPASAQCSQVESLAEPLLFRDSTTLSDGNFTAFITRSGFPATPVREPSDSLVWKEVRANPSALCFKIGGGIGGGVITTVGGGATTINVLGQSVAASDTVSFPLPKSTMDWGNKTAGTQPFHMNPTDTLHYWRYFDIGNDAEPADTTVIKNSLFDSSDYVEAKICLRKLSDSSLVATLDTAMIKKVGIYQSITPNSTSGKYIAQFGFPFDSVYMDVEITRGNALNLWTVSLSDLYGNEEDIGSTSSLKAASRQWQAPSLSLGVEPIVMVIPNPFHTSAQISVDAPVNIPLNVTLFDALGRKLTELANGSLSESHSDYTLNGNTLSTGTYYIRVQSGGRVVTRQVELLK